MTLAWHFREWDVDGWLRMIPSNQFSEWVAFIDAFPSALERGVAQVRSTIHNAMTTGAPASERDYLTLRQRRGETVEESDGHFTRMFKSMAPKGANSAGH